MPPNFVAALTITMSTAFADANQPWTENTTTTVPPEPACTVRLNMRDGGIFGDKTPIDERYIGTKYADPDSPDHDQSLFWNGLFDPDWRGITLDQHKDIAHRKATEQPIELSFQTESGMDGYLTPDNTYYESKPTEFWDTPVTGTPGGVWDATHTNWTKSAETDIHDDAICLRIRNELEIIQNNPPDFSLSYNGNTFANETWAHTGLSDDFDELEKTPEVRMISQEERLVSDRANGQLPNNYDDISAFKMKP